MHALMWMQQQQQQQQLTFAVVHFSQEGHLVHDALVWLQQLLLLLLLLM